MKFGDAVDDNPNGPDRSTTHIADDVFLALTTNKEVCLCVCVCVCVCVCICVCKDGVIFVQ